MSTQEPDEHTQEPDEHTQQPVTNLNTVKPTLLPLHNGTPSSVNAEYTCGSSLQQHDNVAMQIQKYDRYRSSQVEYFLLERDFF
ncbi:hypothetical protein BaRGS_00000084 [Batillaria attramentaria]|uniref:Uncharacterized protein n=1 Tax=Batillaria attramentaria TaxID=370345 RepID=A0ABD0MC22_9CAEN